MVKRAIGEMGIFYGDKSNYGTGFDNGIWMDVLQIPWITKLEEASLYKTVIRTLWLESIGWSREIKTRYPHVKLIGLEDHPLSTHISKMPAKQQQAYIDDLSYLDGIMALTEESREWYQVAVPSVPVQYVGLPFPIDSHEKMYAPLRNEEKEFIGLGVGAADNDRNFVSNILAFKLLQLKNPNLVGMFLSIPHQLLQYCAQWAEQIPNVYIHERTDMAEFYEMLSRCKLVINLADRNTPGRIQGEGAFFGTPVVGSNRLELQNLLWPNFAVSPYALEETVSKAQFILDNPAATSIFVKDARKQLEMFNYEASHERFNKLLNKI